MHDASSVEAPALPASATHSWQMSLKLAVLVVFGLRLGLSLWAALVVTVQPVPTTPDEVLRPYLGMPMLDHGAGRLLLEPWQRHDTNRYLRIAEAGYENVEDSVFPPLFPLLIRAGGWIVRPLLADGATGQAVSNIVAGILISGLAAVGSIALLHQLALPAIGTAAARRSLLYLALFPTSFFLVAVYSESLFLLLALGAFYLGQRDRFWLAGVLAFLATFTRTIGVGLALPLLLLALQPTWQTGRWRRSANLPQFLTAMRRALPALLPLAGFTLFLILRRWLGLPTIRQVYAQYWHQTTSFPGYDLLVAFSMVWDGTGVRAGTFTLLLDMATALLLLLVTVASFRRLGISYGLYAAMMLLFMLLPRSDLKPLYSFSRYALVVFPMFMLAGMVGKHGWVHRLFVYGGLALLLYLSGQFFMWGWVA